MRPSGSSRKGWLIPTNNPCFAGIIPQIKRQSRHPGFKSKNPGVLRSGGRRPEESGVAPRSSIPRGQFTHEHKTSGCNYYAVSMSSSSLSSAGDMPRTIYRTE